MNKRKMLLKYMIDGMFFVDFNPEKVFGRPHLAPGYIGHTGNYREEPRGGTGKAAINNKGGFEYDRTVQKMIDRGEVIFKRETYRETGYMVGPLRISVIEVTDKGREAYKKLKF